MSTTVASLATGDKDRHDKAPGRAAGRLLLHNGCLEASEQIINDSVSEIIIIVFHHLFAYGRRRPAGILMPHHFRLLRATSRQPVGGEDCSASSSFPTTTATTRPARPIRIVARRDNGRARDSRPPVSARARKVAFVTHLTVTKEPPPPPKMRGRRARPAQVSLRLLWRARESSFP